MKIEDIKPGDVIVRTGDGWLFKVAEVTPDRTIMHSAIGKMNEVFCIFSEPQILGWFIEDDYEPATEEQRQYIDSKFAAISGTSPEAESKRITALASMMGDLKQENIELAERVKQLMNDYNKVAKQLRNQPLLSDLTEALDKVEKFERERDLFKKEYEQTERFYESLFNQHDLQSNELKAVREKRDDAKEQYNELQHKYEELSTQLKTAKSKRDYAEKRLDELEYEYYTLKDLHEVALSRLARFKNANFVGLGYTCAHKHNVKVGYLHKSDVKVGSVECLNCEHYIKSDFVNTKTILCAYNYDKKKEKQQEDKFHRKMNSSLYS